MLILSRARGERILIGDDVTITLIDVRGDKARIGIEAPREVKVVREEILAVDPVARAALSRERRASQLEHMASKIREKNQEATSP